VQCIPALARDAQELFVFQRTPSSVDERNNHPIDADWFATLEPGWQRTWLMNFATLQTGGFADEDLVKDGWTDIAQRIRDRIIEKASSGVEFTPELVELAFLESDDEKMEEIRARCDTVVEDPATAQNLKAWYRQLCKRPCFHDEYLEAYNRPNSHLVDTGGKGVERIDETGVWVGGVHHDLDCIVFASGFEVGTAYDRRSGYDTIGRDGSALSKCWADGMQSMHGIHVHGFPNLFIIGFAQAANLISNVTSNLADAGVTIAAVVRHVLDTGAAEVEVSEGAQIAWMELLESAPASSIFGSPECTPGYYNNEGQPLNARARFAMAGYPSGPVAYFEYIERWRNSGDFEGLEFRAR
jgi:cation diffusion facilitator CzcD-associated flavoprotein CzcO